MISFGKDHDILVGMYFINNSRGLIFKWSLFDFQGIGLSPFPVLPDPITNHRTSEDWVSHHLQNAKYLGSLKLTANAHENPHVSWFSYH